jgi:hypothetical protein
MVKLNINNLQIDFGIEQVVKRLFTGGVPNQHVKVLYQERTYRLIKDQEQKILATNRNEKKEDNENIKDMSGHNGYNNINTGKGDQTVYLKRFSACVMASTFNCGVSV